jgi:predicted metal-dependent hydrolase
LILFCYDAGMEYTLKRVGRSRSIRVRVEPTGEVVVTAPRFAPAFMIERMVASNQKWIERQKQRTKLRGEAFPTLDWDKKLVTYMGQLYRIKVHSRSGSNFHSGSATDRIKIEPQEIRINPITGIEADGRKMLVKWLKREGEGYILDRLPKIADEMGIKYGTVRFRQQRSRWGSCSGHGNLSFNWRLVHFKPEIIDYVIVHELSHIKHHNHGARFWAMVEKYDGGYEEKKKFLHQQVVKLEEV